LRIEPGKAVPNPLLHPDFCGNPKRLSKNHLPEEPLDSEDPLEAFLRAFFNKINFYIDFFNFFSDNVQRKELKHGYFKGPLRRM
jgi:hypothetical protein